MGIWKNVEDRPGYLGFLVIERGPEEVVEQSHPPPHHLPPLPLTEAVCLAVEAEAGAVQDQREDERLPGVLPEHGQGGEVSQGLQDVKKLSNSSLPLQPPLLISS